MSLYKKFKERYNDCTLVRKKIKDQNMIASNKQILKIKKNKSKKFSLPVLKSQKVKGKEQLEK